MKTLLVNDVQAVQDIAERIKSDELQHFPEAASFGEAVRQGDIYIFLLDSLPPGCTRIDKPNKQLAPGDTQGSRHCLSSLRGVKLFRLKNPNPYDGPVIEVAKPVTITHPEHGDIRLFPGIFGIGYQRTEDSEGRIRRVQD